jgi:hypothetical protein
MALLLIIASWMLVLSIVLALCVAARRGDQQEERRAEAARPELPTPHRLPVTRHNQSSTLEPAHELVEARGTAA